MQIVTGVPSFIKTINTQIVNAGGTGFNCSVRTESGSYFFKSEQGEVDLRIPSLIKVASRTTSFGVSEYLTYNQEKSLMTIYSVCDDSIELSDKCSLINPSAERLTKLCHTLGFSLLNISHETIKWLFDT